MNMQITLPFISTHTSIYPAHSLASPTICAPLKVPIRYCDGCKLPSIQRNFFTRLITPCSGPSSCTDSSLVWNTNAGEGKLAVCAKKNQYYSLSILVLDYKSCFESTWKIELASYSQQMFLPIFESQISQFSQGGNCQSIDFSLREP